MGNQEKYKLKWVMPLKEVELIGLVVRSHYLLQNKQGWIANTHVKGS